MLNSLTLSALILATLGMLSIALTNKADDLFSMGSDHINHRADGYIALILGPGFAFAAGVIVFKLAPEYYLDTAAMVGSALAFMVPLVFITDFGGLAPLIELPRGILSGEVDQKALIGRTAARAMTRALMKLTPKNEAGGYRDVANWGAFEKELQRLGRALEERYAFVLRACVLGAIISMVIIFNQRLLHAGFGLPVMLALLLLNVLTLVVAYGTLLQVKRSTRALPAAVLAARQAHPPAHRE